MSDLDLMFRSKGNQSTSDEEKLPGSNDIQCDEKWVFELSHHYYSEE